MARSQTTFSKKEREKKKRQKKKEKEARRDEKREHEADGSLDNMIAYVDEFGNIVDTPPDPEEKKKNKVKAKDIVVGVPKQEKEDLSGERRGRVSFYNDSKGYGFISQQGVDERFFVHANNANAQLQEGDKVSFEVEEGPKGLVAVKVRVL